MLNAVTLDYIQHLERGYCENHPDVIAETQAQVVDRAVKQLLTALKALDFDITGKTVRIGERYIRDNESTIQYSNDGLEWLDIGSASGLPAEIANPVDIGTLKLRDNSGVLELSSNDGVAWNPVGLGGQIPSEISNPCGIGDWQIREFGGKLEFQYEDTEFLQAAEWREVEIRRSRRLDLWDTLTKTLTVEQCHGRTGLVDGSVPQTTQIILPQMTSEHDNGADLVFIQKNASPAKIQVTVSSEDILLSNGTVISGGSIENTSQAAGDYIHLRYVEGYWCQLDSRGSWVESVS